MNTALLVNIAALITGIIGAIDIFYHEPKRRQSVRDLAKSGNFDKLRAEQLAAEPSYVEYSKFFFPLLLILVLFLSFSESVNFSLVLVIATFVSGAIWLLDKLFWETARKQSLQKLLSDGGDDIPEIFQDAVSRDPVLVEYSKAFFPIIFIIVVLRSFLYEPFKIPSGSMKPTLEVGDFVLVNKYAYGVRLPVIHTKILDTGSPQRGDVFVFRFPGNPGVPKDEVDPVDYIKRVIGLPGDTIIYKNRRLFIKPACDKIAAECEPVQAAGYNMISANGYQDSDGSRLDIIEEDLLGVKHQILHDRAVSRLNNEYRFNPSCKASNGQDSWVVPEGHYFAMGDNREHSADSRFWCFVPEENLVGKAITVWMNWNSENKYFINFSRIGSID
jgi:signal peptidase I